MTKALILTLSWLVLSIPSSTSAAAPLHASVSAGRVPAVDTLRTRWLGGPHGAARLDPRLDPRTPWLTRLGDHLAREDPRQDSRVPAVEPSRPEPWLPARRASDERAEVLQPRIDPNFWGADGIVSSIVRSGNTLYIAGAFRSVGENSGGGVPFDALTGEPLEKFPRVAGQVHAVIGDGAGGWYIGGDFTAVDGLPRSALAHILADGSVADWNPSVTGSPEQTYPPWVWALALRGGRLYVGGGFKAIGGLPRRNIGCVDARTGAVLDWDPGTHAGGGYVLAFAVHDSTLFVGGQFTSIGGQARSYLAALNATTGVVLPWKADANDLVFTLLVRGDTLYAGGSFWGIAGQSRNLLAALDANTGAVLPFDAHATGVYLDYMPQPAVEALAIAGNTLFVAGDFTEIGGAPRAAVAAVDATTGTATPWSPAQLGPQYAGYPPPLCTSIAVGQGLVYLGGGFDTVGGVSRQHVAAFDTATAALADWDPKPNAAVWALAVASGAVYVGGDFVAVGEWRHRAGVAAIDATTGALKPWNPNPDGSVVTALAVDGGRVFVSGDFTSIGGDPQPRNYLAALDTVNGEALDWHPGADDVAVAFAMLGDTLYVGGYFTQVGGLTRNYLAALNATTGEVTAWDPDADWPVRTMTRSENTIYVGGLFRFVSGLERKMIAAVDAASGTPTAWNPLFTTGVIEALLVTRNVILVGGSFESVNGEARQSLVALDTTTGATSLWNPQPTPWALIHPTVYSLALCDSVLYVGGDFASIGGQPRICLAAVDTATGLATDWDPGANGYVWSLASYGNTVYAGGGFSRAGGYPSAGLAAFSIAQPGPPPPPLPGVAVALVSPNPVASAATVRFALLAAGPVTLEVFDMQGRRVATLLSHQQQAAGWHEQPLPVADWPKGVYFCRLSAADKRATRRFVVLR